MCVRTHVKLSRKGLQQTSGAAAIETAYAAIDASGAPQTYWMTVAGNRGKWYTIRYMI